jgi:hypothetical protein
MIRERATRGKVSNPTRSGRVTPMRGIEPLLVTFVVCLQRIGHPLNQAAFLDLANSLIKGTPLEEKILASKKGGEIGAANGKKYYQNFMKRNSDDSSSKGWKDCGTYRRIGGNHLGYAFRHGARASFVESRRTC